MRLNQLLSFLRLQLFVASLASAVAYDGLANYNVPTFTLDELRLGHRLPELSEILRTSGIFSVRTGSQPSLHRSAAMGGLCRCLEDPFWTAMKEERPTEGVDSILLGDGLTRRTTVATTTVGKEPLPLTENEVLESVCGKETVAAMEILRDEIALVSGAFIKSFDRLNGLGTYDMSNEPPLLESDTGFSYQTISSIVHSANHLEHFHHYRKSTPDAKEKTEDSMVLDWHTDAGLFLSFLPAWDCETSGSKEDDSFLVKLPDGQAARAHFEPGSVAIMMGAGAEHWLRTSLNLKATRHAVKINKGEARTWYGMSKLMHLGLVLFFEITPVPPRDSLFSSTVHLVPEDSVIQESPKRTFADMKNNMKLFVGTKREFSNGEEERTIAIGCGRSDIPADEISNHIIAAPARRRLQHVQDASACNNVTNFFCWTQCLEIPNYEQAESYVAEGNSLYCLDPGILARSGNQVSKAVEPCIGKVHNSNCQGIWHPTSPSVEGWPVEYNVTFTVEEQYCYGGTSMYMDGFHWIHDTTCVIYLFPGWVLSSRGRFIAACFGTLLFGIMVEAVISKRRSAMSKLEPGRNRLMATAAFYGLQLTMGYLIMLVVMTYSLPLFFCCVLGLVGGHVLFNAKDALLKNSDTPASDASSNNTVRGESQGDGDDENCTEGIVAKDSCCSKAESDQGVPEGATPCCQNSLEV